MQRELVPGELQKKFMSFTGSSGSSLAGHYSKIRMIGPGPETPVLLTFSITSSAEFTVLHIQYSPSLTDIASHTPLCSKNLF